MEDRLLHPGYVQDGATSMRSSRSWRGARAGSIAAIILIILSALFSRWSW